MLLRRTYTAAVYVSTMPQLSQEQADAIRALEWLYNPEARIEGRTTVIAIATIRIAATFPMMSIPVRDHYPMMPDHLVRVIRDFVGADPLLNPVCVWSRLHNHDASLVFDMRTPIHQWLPLGWTQPRRPARVSLDEQARQMRDLLEQGVSLPDQTIDALLYALEASEVNTVLTAGQVRAAVQLAAPPSAPSKGRSLWDYLEDS